MIAKNVGLTQSLAETSNLLRQAFYLLLEVLNYDWSEIIFLKYINIDH